MSEKDNFFGRPDVLNEVCPKETARAIEDAVSSVSGMQFKRIAEAGQPYTTQAGYTYILNEGTAGIMVTAQHPDDFTQMWKKVEQSKAKSQG